MGHGSARLLDILILENDHDNRQMLGYLFEANHCVARTVASLREAETALRERTPDVVLCDLNLADGERGCALAERLQSDPCTRHVARIAMTGDADPSADSLRAFDALERKPFEVARILRLVRQLGAASRVERLMSIAP